MRVAVFDDQQWMIDAVRVSLDLAQMDLVLAARSGREFLAGLKQLDDAQLPDVVILDKRTRDNPREGLDVAARIREAHPEVGILLISLDLEPSDAKELMDLPGDGLGVIGKDAIAEHATLTKVIETVGMGARFVERGLRARLNDSSRHDRELDRLTRRQEQTLDYAAQGLSNAEIAEKLGPPGRPLSERAVETYCSELYRALGLTQGRQNRVLAVNIWKASGRQPRP